MSFNTLTSSMLAELSVPAFTSIAVEVSFSIDSDWTAGAWTPHPFVAIGFGTQSGGTAFPGLTFWNSGRVDGDDDDSNHVTGLPAMVAGVPYIMRLVWDATGVQFSVNGSDLARMPSPLFHEGDLAAGPMSDMKVGVWVQTGGGGDLRGTVDYVDIEGDGSTGAALFWTELLGTVEVA